MVINIALAKEGRFDELTSEIAAVRAAVPAPGVLKVIIESAALTDEEIVAACKASEEAGADFVKTSTGFGGGGATTDDIALMHSLVGGRLGIKASGGVRTYQDAVAMVTAGATRIGASSSLDIVEASNDDASGSSSPGAY